MAVTPNPAFAQAINVACCVLTAAKTTYNDTTNALQLNVAGANGSLIHRVSAIPRATVTATQMQLYRHDGSNIFLCSTMLISAYTMAQTSKDLAYGFPAGDETFISLQNSLYLPAGWSLYVGAGVALAGGIVVTGEGVDL